ncbi:MAG: tRNA pseudouridine(55) synthase TruB [Gemmatimonadetes bacterium]|nr:tRNA pseudouridine(55) synthase TruB [Gemmatimonadota bacterium]MYH53624.1 tRNA pseudouridine(55) synthase TruB [Gemmatimonadota bacterium]MYK65592.1 tRNA pseudouridine(55) synthase TruB [Gemmatimonadota bacterium]
MGMLLVDKPAGITSHDVVAVVRRSLRVRKAGHAGTLDPFATGLLVLGIGRATRLLEYLAGLDKEYLATARLGVATDSQDPEGSVTAEDDCWRSLDTDRIRTAAAAMAGRLAQSPPVYSAVKVGGVPAHRRVRRGEAVELPAREVTVHALEVLAVDLPEVRFRAACSSGTYVRSLAVELGGRLGTGCHLTALRRTRVGGFDVRDAAPLEAVRGGEVPARSRVDAVPALAHLPRVVVEPGEAAMLATGKRVPKGAPDCGVAVFALPGDRLVAVGAVRDGVLEPRKVFHRA